MKNLEYVRKKTKTIGKKKSYKNNPPPCVPNVPNVPNVIYTKRYWSKCGVYLSMQHNTQIKESGENSLDTLGKNKLLFYFVFYWWFVNIIARLSLVGIFDNEYFCVTIHKRL